MKNKFTLVIVLAMFLGILAGLAANANLAPDQIKAVTGGLEIVTTVFLRLIKMVIAPLVFTTLVVGIAHMESATAIGRVGAKSLVWFMGASLLSLTLGLVLVNLLQPGSGFTPHEAAATSGVTVKAFHFAEFVAHIVPQSIFAALAENEILQIVVFSCFVGTAIAALGREADQIVVLAEQGAQVMLKVTGYVMLFAPAAVFAAITATVANQGAKMLLTYVTFVGDFYFAMLTLWVLLFTLAAILLHGKIGPLLKAARQPALLAFSTASSEAAYPKLLAELEDIGIPKRVVSFVLPLGYSFNLDGSMLYCTFATMFIAQAYHITLTLPQQITLLLMMMVTSKGMAGVPRASLVVIAAAMPYFGIPDAGLLLILAVDHLLDMGRSATNVIGNSVACVAVSRWEGIRK